ncbi:hypothetical protein AURDEDRAFT_171632 [Auricularia subglabra TFB-10046 SS5]|nr:hypothetical protein AURDEDRAFT_171632 [Auricularia subglabra TFB-10046 SS5]
MSNQVNLTVSSGPGSSGIPRLPPELVTAALKYLPPNELRLASTVSTEFYHAAHAAGLTLRRTIVAERAFRPPGLARFVEITRYAATCPLLFRLGLSVIVARNQEDRNEFVPSMIDISHALQNAMPFLVDLDVLFPAHFADIVYAGLGEAAPRLRTLSLTQHGNNGALPVPIPATLFAGNAPCLQVVTLHVPALPPSWAPVPAWNRVHTLKVFLQYPVQCLSIARFFPALKDFHLHCMAWVGEFHPLAAHRVDMSGLSLRSLTIINDSDTNEPLDDHALAPAPHPTISTVKHLCGTVQYDRCLWPDNNCQFNAHFQRFYTGLQVTLFPTDSSPSHVGFIFNDHGPPHGLIGMTVSVSSTDGSWSNTQYTRPVVPLGSTNASPLATLPPLSTRLVSLTVDEALLPQTLQAAVVLDALRELFVDFTPIAKLPHTQPQPRPDIMTRRARLRCPALERVTAFATQPEPVTVSCTKIVALGRLLCRPLGVDRLRAELVLAYVLPDRGVERQHPRMDEVFSSVRLDSASTPLLPTYFHSRDDNPRLKMHLPL